MKPKPFRRNSTSTLKLLLLSGALFLLAIPSDQNSTQAPFPAYQAAYMTEFYSCPTHQSVLHPLRVVQSPLNALLEREAGNTRL